MSEYLKVDGHDLYCYEWDNDGEAVVLLHGGLSKTSSWDYLVVPALEDDFHVFAYDRTAHGFTADRPGSLHFDFQTREAIAYLETIVKEPSHLVGYSDGAVIALMVAIQRPDLVKSLVLVGANYHYSGTVIHMPFVEPSEEDKAEYAATSPDAPHTQNEKIKKMLRIWDTEPDIAISELAKIQCPTLIIAGDDDVISAKESEKIYQAIANARLAIVPGSSHAVIKEKTELVQALLKDFYANPDYPLTQAPVSRINNR